MSTTRQDQIVTIYTDGACKGNPGKGGWGAVLNYAGHSKEIFGGEFDTTNNRMELMAAIKALSLLKKACVIHLYTDSQYVKNGIETWLAGWKKRGWRTANKGPVKNQDLWQQLDEVCQRHEIHWKWVKGHSGDTMNDLADELANKGVESINAKR